jgi:enediyne biosynthesis protein E4
MRSVRPLRLIALLGATVIVTPGLSSSSPPASATEAPSLDQRRAELRRGLLEHQSKALALLDQASADGAAGQRDAFVQGLKQAVAEIDVLLSAEIPADLAGQGFFLIPSAQKGELARVRAQLDKRAAAPGTELVLDAYRPALEAAGKCLRPAVAFGLEFQGSYTQPVIQVEAVGGHASAMGPPPRQISTADEGPSTVEFVEMPGILTEKTFSGGKDKDHILESGAGGVALFDYDGDGKVDIFIAATVELDAKREKIQHRATLLKNLGHWKFKDVTREAGLDRAGWGQGVCVGDFDDDGRLDLYVTNYGPNFLFRNNGNGTFTEVAAKAGVQGDGGWSTGCSFFDAKGNGKLDLYVARYMTVGWDEVVNAKRTMKWRGEIDVMAGPVHLPGASDLFFENRGDGTFVEAAAAHGLADTSKAYGFSVVTSDFNGDGFTDVFVANDSMPNFLYQNDGKGHFESVGLSAGVALNNEARAQAGMGADAGDYDNDGKMDIVLTTFARDTKTLYHNVGGGQFEDASAAVGFSERTFDQMGWGVTFLDADLDGWLDVFFANGHLYPQVDANPMLKESYRQKNQLLLNDGTGRFRNVSDRAGSGLQIEEVSRGLAAADLDDDGDLDLVITNVDAAPTVLQNKQQVPRHWSAFRLTKPGRNKFAIGARVTLIAGGRRQIREVRSGGSYLSQSDLRVFFGLGDYKGTVEVEVQLPGQGHWAWKALPIDGLSTLTLDDAHAVKAAPPKS